MASCQMAQFQDVPPPPPWQAETRQCTKLGLWSPGLICRSDNDL